MRFAQAYGPGKFGLSFELFPPKTPAGEAELFHHVAHLMEFHPDYVTCTYGAGGSTRAKTLEVVAEVQRRFGCMVASHLTCVGSTVDDLCGYLADAESRGVQNIVALRGDPRCPLPFGTRARALYSELVLEAPETPDPFLAMDNGDRSPLGRRLLAAKAAGLVITAETVRTAAQARTLAIAGFDRGGGPFAEAGLR